MTLCGYGRKYSCLLGVRNTDNGRAPAYAGPLSGWHEAPPLAGLGCGRLEGVGGVHVVVAVQPACTLSSKGRERIGGAKMSGLVHKVDVLGYTVAPVGLPSSGNTKSGGLSWNLG
jgi:hypothetical protein